MVKRFKVSRPTVARALRTLGDEGLLERRAGSGTYARSPSAAPHQLPASTRTLALLVPLLGNTEIFQLIAGELARCTRSQNYSLLWGESGMPQLDTDSSLRHGAELCEQFVDKGVDGVFFTPYELVEGRRRFNEGIAQKLHGAGIPVVLLDRDLTAFPRRSGFDVVGVDNVAGGFAIGEHFIKLGCRRLCFIHPPRSAPTIEARIAGVRQAMVEYGIGNRVEFSKEWVFEGEVTDQLFVRKVLAKGKPDAIACSNDHTAALLLQGLAKAGISVPGDVKIAGFDDVRFATLVSPPLTTIQQPYREIAASLFRTMLDRLEEPQLPPRQISLAPRLVIRESCGAYL